eukprot:gene4381-biopygen4322
MCAPSCGGPCPEEVREWLVGSWLVALLKGDLGVKIRPMACGNVSGSSWRRSHANSMQTPRGAQGPLLWTAAGWRTHRAAGSPDWGGGKSRSGFGGPHCSGSLDQHPEWVCVEAEAKNAFNALHHDAMLEVIEQDFAEPWAWKDLCHGVQASLRFWLGSADGSVMQCVKSKEDTRFAYLEDACFFESSDCNGARIWYINVGGNSDCLDVSADEALLTERDASRFADEMQGARGELDFTDILEVPVGRLI